MLHSIAQLIIEQWKAVCTLIFAGTTALFYKKIKEFFIGMWKKGAFLLKIDKTSEEIKKEVADLKESNKEILAQIKVNGGSSLKDATNRIENSLKEISDKIDSNNVSIWAVTGSMSFRMDEKGKVINVSQKLLNLLGVSEEDFLGEEWYKLLTPKDSFRIKSDFIEYKNKGLNYEEDGTFVRKSDQKHIHARITLNTIRGANRNITNYVGEIKLL